MPALYINNWNLLKNEAWNVLTNNYIPKKKSHLALLRNWENVMISPKTADAYKMEDF